MVVVMLKDFHGYKKGMVFIASKYIWNLSTDFWKPATEKDIAEASANLDLELEEVK